MVAPAHVSTEQKEAMIEALLHKGVFTDRGAALCITLPGDVVYVDPDKKKLCIHGAGIGLAESYLDVARLAAVLDEAWDMATTYRLYSDSTAREKWPTGRCEDLRRKIKETQGV